MGEGGGGRTPIFRNFPNTKHNLPIKAPDDAVVAPFAPMLEPLGNGSSLAFFLAEPPLPEGPAVCSSS